MTNKYKDKANNDILLDIKRLQMEHESLKQKMLKDYDRLMTIEKEFSLANLEITTRLKGNKN